MTIADGGWGYLIVWEFSVKAEQHDQFEQVYGAEGTWAQLFRRAEGYLRSELVHELEDSSRYLTFDFWTSRSAYERFREQSSIAYQAIDQQCEAMTEREAEVGRFEPVRGS